MNTEIKIKMLREGAVLPTTATDGSVGYDVFLPEDVCIFAKSRTKIPLGFALEMPDDVFCIIKGRSGCGVNGVPGKYGGKYNANVIDGVIDTDYRGELNLTLQSFEFCSFCLGKGQRIAQLVFLPRVSVSFSETDSLSETARGDKGFNSSGI